MPDHWKLKPFFSVCKERCNKNTGMINDNLLPLSYGKVIKKDINNTEGLLPKSFETYQIIKKDNVIFELTDLQNAKSLRSAIAEKRDNYVSIFGCRFRKCNYAAQAKQICQLCRLKLNVFRTNITLSRCNISIVALNNVSTLSQTGQSNSWLI